MTQAQPPYGDQVVSWLVVRDQVIPHEPDGELAHDDYAARDMHRLRGLILGQATETETVLRMIGTSLGLKVNEKAMMGNVLESIRCSLSARPDHDEFASWLETLGNATASRNRCAHRAVTIGSSWRSYTTGGGEWVPVISFLGTEELGEPELLIDLALQQEATEAAVLMAEALGTRY